MTRLISCCFFVLSAFSGVAQSPSAIKNVIERYKEFLLLTDTATVSSVASIAPLSDDGTWSDIDYANDQPGVWAVAEHMQRIRSLAIAWSSKKSALFHSTVVLHEITAALDHWENKKYKSRNWWHNKIGIPQIARDVIILMKDSLTEKQFTNALTILAQYKLNGTGANLTWSADLGLHYGALTGNTALMKACRDTILSAVTVTDKEGVQADYSFHQHGKRMQMYHYGAAFLLNDVRLAWELDGSWIAFPAEKIQVLTNFVLNGWQWMARGINTVPGTIDRAVSRHGALHSADIRKIIPILYKIQPDSISAFKKMLDFQQGKRMLIGYRYFPYSDFTAYQQKQFSFFLKTNSVRTLLTESINEENLKGDLLNSGDAYFIGNGNEYFNLMPFWNWNYLPGITSFLSDNKNKISRRQFTGNVGDGESGLATMDYCLQKNEQQLRAKKMWASYKNTVVAMVAGPYTANIDDPAFTVMDQCRWQSDVTVNQPGNKLNEGESSFKNLRWLRHNNFVYIPLYADSIQINLQNKRGNWASINRSEPDKVINDKVFTARIIHAKNSTASGYVVSFAGSDKEADAIATKPTWTVLKNDSLCQAVKFKDGMLMATFYHPGKLTISGKVTLAVNKSCAIMMKGNTLYISDPAHVGGIVEGTAAKEKFSISVPADGTTTSLELAGSRVVK